MSRADEINALTPDAFVARFGHLFEHSSWVVEAAAARRPFGGADEMLAAFAAIVHEAGKPRQLDLLRAHPELAGKAMIDHTLTEASASEQASAGLDRLTPEEYKLFHERNGAYRARFGFPFIICVRLTDKAGILEAMRNRLDNDAVREFDSALAEVLKIVELRLNDALKGQAG